MQNRSVPPPITPIYNIPLPYYTAKKLVGDVPLFHFQSENYEVVKIELVFHAGRFFEKKRLISKTTHLLLKSGTATKTSQEINETIDFYGATIGLPINFDHGSVVLYCLSKYVKDLLPLVLDLIANPTFPQDELDFHKEQQQSRLKVALENADTLAFRKITEEIFGKDHPYGYNGIAENIDAITQADLLEHHRRLYHQSNCKVYISGNLLTADLEALRVGIGNLSVSKPPAPIFPVISEASLSSARAIKIDKPDKVQTAIRIGRKTFARKHEDYQKLYLFGVLLGGYFGSRLSTVIREEKGYTYGIHTSMDAMSNDGCFLITTEVAKEYTEKTLAAIYEEIADMRDHAVDEEELLQMKRYLQGYLLNSVDGVFRSATVLRGLQSSGVDSAYFESLQACLQEVTPKDMQEIAIKYFQKKDLWEVVVG